ncbi:protein SAWADEE HOMEODOMAIN HOMOLOG 2-like [Rutidosis leptorrhynchoides]|uniref:protein SAWADEE HOMEODOMAIN HOMOLOG 2-like n=1 Tax=Rutidosis leptorrhynchoides TaxID=125765 RepID=UPI003A99921D
MGRPPSNGVPAFRFNPSEVTEMEAILRDHNNALPAKEIMEALAEKFSDTPERKGQVAVQVKQVWNWFQNKRYATRAKNSKAPFGYPTPIPVPRDESRNVFPHASAASSLPMPITAPVPAPIPTPVPVPSGTLDIQHPGRGAAETTMEFEAKSARDGAWYDVQCFLAHRNFDSSDPEVQVRFVGFGSDEDEWMNVRRHVRQRSLPCEASECVAVLPGDLILCFQEGKDQALYFDAHVLDAQRRRHDARGCRCRFLVRYDHDQAEEIVPLRKVCRRPQTDYRLQQLNAANGSASVDQPKTNVAASTPAGMPRVALTAVPKPANPATPSNISVAASTTTPPLTTGTRINYTTPTPAPSNHAIRPIKLSAQTSNINVAANAGAPLPGRITNATLLPPSTQPIAATTTPQIRPNNIPLAPKPSSESGSINIPAVASGPASASTPSGNTAPGVSMENVRGR